jgi:hypothetical protein
MLLKILLKMLSKDNAIIIVDKYLDNLINFLSTKDYNILLKIEDDISYIMGLIGYYELTEQLKKIYYNPQIQSYYAYSNIYFETILMAVLKKNNKILDILKEYNINFDENQYIQIINEQLKFNSDIKKFIVKISSFLE